jgi:hypothetical protein
METIYNIKLCNEINLIRKNVILYPHIPFKINDGGVTVHYELARILDEYGVNVRIYNNYGIINNEIFNKYYENDFPIDDNTVVIYCEAIRGNPLNCKHVVRWILSPTQKDQEESTSDEKLWGKEDLVYYFNSEKKIVDYLESDNPDRNIYKFLASIYIHPEIKNRRFNSRSGYCHTIRKINYHFSKNETPIIYYMHPHESIEIDRSHNQDDYINIFNKCEYFVSYDPLTFLSIMASLCGCISIIYPIKNVTKKEWLKLTGIYTYFKDKNEYNLYGIAYGNSSEEIQYAQSTLDLVEEQWKDILKFNKENSILSFINDINDWSNMKNTSKNIHNSKKIIEKFTDLNVNLYKLFNEDLINLSEEDLIKHYNYYGKFENRISCNTDFYSKYPEFNLDAYKLHNKKFLKFSECEIMNHYSKYRNSENTTEKIYYENMDIKYFVDYLKKNNIKILIDTSSYTEFSGGNGIMHYLCHLINYITKTNISYIIHNKNKSISSYTDNDFNLETNKNYITPLATRDILLNRNNIVIYPESVFGNPLEQKYVVRWILYFPPESSMKSWNKDDLILWFCDLYRKYNNDYQKFNNNINIEVKNKEGIFSILSNLSSLLDIKNYKKLNKKDECCFTIRKKSIGYHRKIYQHINHPNNICNNCLIGKWPIECNCNDFSDGVELKHNKKYNKVYRFEYPIKISDEIELFKNTGTFYCYDPFCFSAVIAVLHNCLTIIPKLEIFGDNNIYENVPWMQYGISYGEDNESINNALRTLPFAKILLNNLFFNINYDNMKIFFESIYNHFFTKRFVTNIQDRIKLKKPKILIYMKYNGNEIKSLLETNIVFKDHFEIIVSNNNLEEQIKDIYILIYEYQNSIKDIVENIPEYLKKISLSNSDMDTDIKIDNYLLEINSKRVLYIVNEIVRLLDINIKF